MNSAPAREVVGVRCPWCLKLLGKVERGAYFELWCRKCRDEVKRVA